MPRGRDEKFHGFTCYLHCDKCFAGHTQEILRLFQLVLVNRAEHGFTRIGRIFADMKSVCIRVICAIRVLRHIAVLFSYQNAKYAKK